MSHPAKPSALTLGVPGFTYADLYRPERLRDLHEVFLREVGGADPDLLRRWDEYRADPGAPRPAPDVSLLYVRMAPYLSGFLARLFGIGDEGRGLAAADRQRIPPRQWQRLLADFQAGHLRQARIRTHSDCQDDDLRRIGRAGVRPDLDRAPIQLLESDHAVIGRDLDAVPLDMALHQARDLRIERAE